MRPWRSSFFHLAAFCGWPASTGVFTFWQPPATFTFWKHGQVASLEISALWLSRTLLIFQSEHNPEGQDLLRVWHDNASAVCHLLPACRETGLFKARTSQRGLFYQGQTYGFEPAFLNIRTRQIGQGVLSTKHNQPHFPSDFLEFMYWQLQALGTQKRWVLPLSSSQSTGGGNNTLEKINGSVRW